MNAETAMRTPAKLGAISRCSCSCRYRYRCECKCSSCNCKLQFHSHSHFHLHLQTLDKCLWQRTKQTVQIFDKIQL